MQCCILNTRLFHCNVDVHSHGNLKFHAAVMIKNCEWCWNSLWRHNYGSWLFWLQKLIFFVLFNSRACFYGSCDNQWTTGHHVCDAASEPAIQPFSGRDSSCQPSCQWGKTGPVLCDGKHELRQMCGWLCESQWLTPCLWSVFYILPVLHLRAPLLPTVS
jgi:hypothetical protein